MMIGTTMKIRKLCFGGNCGLKAACPLCRCFTVLQICDTIRKKFIKDLAGVPKGGSDV